MCHFFFSLFPPDFWLNYYFFRLVHCAQVTYTIKRLSKPGTGELHSKMEAVHLDGDGEKKKVATPLNMTNHAYWNLSGNHKRSIRGHGLLLRCDRYLPLDDNQVCASFLLIFFT